MRIRRQRQIVDSLFRHTGLPRCSRFHLPRLVGDPINNRLVVINPVASASASVSSIGAIDLATGEVEQLLAPASP